MSNLSDNEFYFTQFIEVTIRGRYLRFSASVEGLMTKCIVYLNEVKTKNSEREEAIDFKNFTFFKKEDKFKKLLKNVYPDLYNKNSPLFKALTSFREMRNKMAHCYFTWDESDLTNVIIWDLEDSKNKPYRIVPTTYSIQEISDSLQESMKAIIIDMNKLADEVINKVKPIIPHMFEKL